jgi:hypothetical protein
VPAAKVAAEQLRLMGNVAFKEGRLPGALLQYQAATKEDACNPLLYNNISLVQLKMGKVMEVRARLLSSHLASSAAYS